MLARIARIVALLALAGVVTAAAPSVQSLRLEGVRTVLAQPPIRNLNERFQLQNEFIVIHRIDAPDNALPVIVAVSTGRAIPAPFLKGNNALLGATPEDWVILRRDSHTLQVIARANGAIRASVELPPALRVRGAVGQYLLAGDQVWINERTARGTSVHRYALPGLRAFAPTELPILGRLARWEGNLVIAGTSVDTRRADERSVEIYDPLMRQIARFTVTYSASRRSQVACDEGFLDSHGPLLVFAASCEDLLVVDLRARRLQRVIVTPADPTSQLLSRFALHRGMLLTAQRLLSASNPEQTRLHAVSLGPDGGNASLMLDTSEALLSHAGVGISHWDASRGATTSLELNSVTLQ